MSAETGARAVRWPAAAGVLAGLALAVYLVLANNGAAILHAMTGAGWRLAPAIALHLPQTLLSALGWRVLVADPKRPRIAKLFELRFIREAVNALLPVAQIGGDVVRARLLAHSGVGVATAAASCVVDLTLEMATQIVFAALGLALLVVGPHAPGIARTAALATLAALAITVSFAVAQRRGAFRGVGERIARLARGGRWAALAGPAGLDGAIQELYGDPRRCWTAAAFHLGSWLFGALETWAGLWALGLHATLREAVVIESLGQAVRGLGFLAPGALGVQEGGYILICSLFGVSPQSALALSLIRRVREVVLGTPGLLDWQRIEGKRLVARWTARPPVATEGADSR